MGLCWVLTVLILTGNDCETFWDKDHLTNSCYQFNFQSTLSWREAWNSCEQQGANLLSITEIHEQTYINGEMMAAWLSTRCPHLRQSWWHRDHHRCQVTPPDLGSWSGDGDRLGVQLGPGGLILPLGPRAADRVQLHTLDWAQRPGHQRRLAVVGQLAPQVPQLGER